MRRLIIRPGAIGDFIVSLPALESLRADYLEVWTRPTNVPLVRFADRARSIESMGLDLLGVTDPPATLLHDLRSFDSIVSWYATNRPDFRELTARLNLPFVFLPSLPGESSAVHATDFYLDQVRALGFQPASAVPRIACSVTHENFAVIHPFSSSARKNWPLENFRRLARELERSIPVRWCAGMDDPPLDGAIQMESLWDLACFLARARLYVGNDSGITHLAAAVGTPTIALFGPSTHPKIWAPRGPNVRVVYWSGLQ